MLTLLHDLVNGFDWFVLWYFVGLNVVYLLLMALAARALREYHEEYSVEVGVELPREFMKPFSILVPAYNEGPQIVQTVRALLELDYPEYEVIVASDGSTDNTLDTLREAFQLEPADIEIEQRFTSEPVRTIFFSHAHPRLVVIDKGHGGKPDTLNAAASLARYPYVCAVDADSVLSTDSMKKLMQRFIATPSNVAVGGIVRLANGCEIHDGKIARVGMPAGTLEKIQVVEYLRAFLFGRLGWSRANILMIISGAFTVLRQDVLERVGGWRREAIGEDIDVVLSIHRLIQEKHRPFRLSFAPDPVCWTQAPKTAGALSIQRDRWQRALIQSLGTNMRMLFNPRYHRIGMIGLPYFLIFEMFGGVIEFVGFPVAITSYFLGIVDIWFLLLFFAMSVLFGLTITYGAIALEEMSYRRYRGRKALVQLFLAGFLENFGYRQLHAFWRFKGTVRYLFGKRADWGTIPRERFAEVNDAA